MCLHEEEYKGFKIKIETDEDPFNPRTDYDNVGTMVCFHRRYTLGDSNHGFDNPQKLKDYLKENKDNIVSLPVFMYDHSGITINTTGFSCPWDSGQIGMIFVSKERAKNEWNVEDAKQIEDRLRSEVEDYDKYLRGAIVGYVVKDENEEVIDSCWGFLEQDDAIYEAKNAIKFEINRREETNKFYELTFAL